MRRYQNLAPGRCSRIFTCGLLLAHLVQPGGRGETALPEAPSAVAAAGSVLGTVLDVNGGVVPNAKVTLDGQNGSFEREAVTDSAGHFNFDDVLPGTYSLTIAAAGLKVFKATPFVVRSGEHHEIPQVALPIAQATADVVVTVTEEQLATEQIHAEEQQRVLGILPNFYSSYIWDAAPLNRKQKFGLAAKAVTDPVAFLAAGYVAGVEQANNAFKGYGQGAQGYGKRYGAAFADGAIGIMLSDAILPSLFHQDPRYYYRGSGTTRSRALYAVSTAFICKGDNGHWQPNYSHILGGLTTGAISNAYYPSGDRGVGLTFETFGIGVAGDMAGGLIREFVLRRLTHKVPDFAQGKPAKP